MKKQLTDTQAMKLYDKCVRIYDKDGSYGVIDYCNTLDMDWHYCIPCEEESPVIKSPSHNMCAVCGHEIDRRFLNQHSH